MHVGARHAELGRDGVDGLGRQAALLGLSAAQAVEQLGAGPVQPPLELDAGLAVLRHRQMVSGTILIAPAGHSSTQIPQPLQKSRSNSYW